MMHPGESNELFFTLLLAEAERIRAEHGEDLERPFRQFKARAEPSISVAKMLKDCPINDTDPLGSEAMS